MLSDHFIKRQATLRARLMRIVKSPQAAEDLTQEAYLRVSRALETRAITHLDAFLSQTALNLARDHERQRRRRSETLAEPAALAEIADEAPDAETALMLKQREAALSRAFAALPARARDAWQLCHGEGLTYAEIASRLGVSRNTVYNDIKLVIGHCHDVLHRDHGL